MSAQAWGVDIGGSTVKAALVDTATGFLVSDRITVPTPQPSTPQAVTDAVRAVLTTAAGDTLPVGITVPGVLQDGTVSWVGNLDPSFVGLDPHGHFTQALGRPVTVLNDADAAAVAEARFGAAYGVSGTILVLTLGTGVGSALLYDGVLVPNTELGQVPLDGVPAEGVVSAAAREREGLGWEQWAARLERYLALVESLIWPQLIVIGGAVSKHGDCFLPLLSLRTPVVAAELRGDAGLAGVAALAHDVASPARGRHSRH